MACIKKAVDFATAYIQKILFVELFSGSTKFKNQVSSFTVIQIYRQTHLQGVFISIRQIQTVTTCYVRSFVSSIDFLELECRLTTCFTGFEDRPNNGTYSSTST